MCVLFLAEPGGVGHHYTPHAQTFHRTEARLQPIRQHQVRAQGSEVTHTENHIYDACVFVYDISLCVETVSRTVMCSLLGFSVTGVGRSAPSLFSYLSLSRGFLACCLLMTTVL